MTSSSIPYLFSMRKLLTTTVATVFLVTCCAAQAPSRNNQTVDGYKGIWFTLGQFSEYGDKYSGGLATYTSSHIPVGVYSKQTDKTFFVYGGTTPKDKK